MRRLWAPVEVGGLVFFRIALGGLLTVEVWRQWANGWIASNFSAPPFHFSFYGFEWVRALPEPWMTVHFAALAVLGLCLMLGFATRGVAALSLLGWGYVFLIDRALYLNHLYLVLLLLGLMVVVPSNRAVSIDARLRPALRASTTPAWTLWLLRAQLGLPYFFGGVAKLNGDWLHGEPMRTWLQTTAFHAEWAVVGASFGGLLFDLLIVPALLWRRTRWFALLLALGFHLTNAWLFQIGIFPWLMIAGTLLFLPPVVFTALSGEAPSRGVERPQRPTRVLALLGTWALVQVALPLRHWLYPGDVAWTEEGQLFAWRMKLTDKDNQTAFLVTFKSDGKVWHVPLSTFLTQRQEDKMAGDPEMIWQFAHHLKALLGDIEVHVSTRTSLNGHPARPLLDENVDLASKPRPLGAASWILSREN